MRLVENFRNILSIEVLYLKFFASLMQLTKRSHTVIFETENFSYVITIVYVDLFVFFIIFSIQMKEETSIKIAQLDIHLLILKNKKLVIVRTIKLKEIEYGMMNLYNRLHSHDDLARNFRILSSIFVYEYHFVANVDSFDDYEDFDAKNVIENYKLFSFSVANVFRRRSNKRISSESIS